MVQNGVLKQRGYSSDGGRVSKSCFAVKAISEKVKECEKAVDKVHSILKSLKILVSRYDS